MKIKNYENYLISKNGSVYSLKSKKFLKPNIDRKGYHRFGLTNIHGSKCLTSHRLVALHFIPNPLDLPQVDHIDEDKSNNKVSNLQWITNLNNITKSQGKQVQCVETGIIYKSIHDAAKQTSKNFSNIARVCRGEANSYHNQHWKFI